MFSLRIYIRIILHVALVIVVAGTGVIGIISGKAIILGSVALLIALWLAGVLVYYLNTSTGGYSFSWMRLKTMNRCFISRKTPAPMNNAASMPPSTVSTN